MLKLPCRQTDITHQVNDDDDDDDGGFSNSAFCIWHRSLLSPIAVGTLESTL